MATTREREEGARRGIDRMTKRYIEHTKLTPSQARERARRTADRNERKKDESK